MGNGSIVFIMCQGNKKYKSHFLDLYNDTILTRTLKQVNEYRVVVVADQGYYARICPSLYNCVEVYSLINPIGLLKGIYLSIKDFPCDRAIILLGDVIYSNRLIRIIKQDDKKFRIYGRSNENVKTGKVSPEIFALSISKEVIPSFLSWALSIWMMNDEADLWFVLAKYGNLLDLRSDYSDDIDSEIEYSKYFQEMERLVIQDDEHDNRRTL